MNLRILKSGKTSISNYLADSQDAVSKDYRPTQGVRIVEFESNQLELDGERVNAEVIKIKIYIFLHKNTRKS